MDKLKKLRNWLSQAGLRREAAQLSSLRKEAISKTHINQLKEWLGGDYSQLSFDDLFDGKLRIAIPLKTEQEAELSKVLKPLVDAGWRPAGNGGLFDIKKVKHKARRLGGQEYVEEIDVADFKVAKSRMKTIPSGPRAGEVVESKKVLSLAKAIREVSSEEAFNWWQENQTEYAQDFNWKQVEAVFDGDNTLEGQSIIISRDPIDVLRMSDHRGISSCHSQGGAFFECAIAESRGTGLIAYLVDNSDLRKLLTSGPEDSSSRPDGEKLFDISDFDKKEIFADSQRNVSGIMPKSRVRLRKYVNEEDDYEFAAPENRTYGPHPPGFVEAVRSWAWDQQKSLFGGDNDLPDQTWLEMHGGSYRDTNDGVILNSFFEQGGFATNYSGNVDTISENEEDTYSMWEAEIEEVMTRARAELKHVGFHAEVDGDLDDPYVVAWVDLSFEVPYELPRNPYVNMPEGDAWSWSYSEQTAFRLMLQHPEGNLEEFGVNPERKVIYGRVDFRCEDCNNPDDVSAHLDYIIRDVDRNYNEYVEKVRRKLVEAGYIAEIEFDRAEKRLENATLKNFYFVGSSEDNDGEILISLKPENSIELSFPNVLDAEDIPNALKAKPHPSTFKKYLLGEEYKVAVLSVLRKIAEESLRQLSLDFGDGWIPDEAKEITMDQIANNFDISTSLYGISDLEAKVNLAVKILVGDDPEQIKFLEKFIHNIDENFEEIKDSIKEVAQNNIDSAKQAKIAEKASFRAGDLAKPVIEELKKTNQPDVVRLAIWVEKNWDTFNDAEKEVAYYSFLLPTQRDGDYIHKHELDAPRFWDGIMQKRPDTDLSYRWKGLSMKDVMPYTDPNSEVGKDPNFGRGGAWVDERGRISPPTVAQLEKLFILK